MRPWSEWVPPEEAARRAGGRRRINGLRRDRARLRRAAIGQWLLDSDLSLFEAGVRARLAARFGISRRTASRDLAALVEECGRRPWTLEGEFRAQGISLDEVVREMMRHPFDDDLD